MLKPGRRLMTGRSDRLGPDKGNETRIGADRSNLRHLAHGSSASSAICLGKSHAFATRDACSNAQHKHRYRPDAD
jgi:hypothetical protein